MPARIIKQSICTSESMAALSWFEQILFIRLIVSADDFGRFDGRPAIIRGALFPLDDVTVKAIRDALSKLSTQGMVNLYEVGGKPTLELTAWRKHNKPRAKESKYPSPDEYCSQMQTDANRCKQMHANAPVIRNSNSEFDIRNSEFDIRNSDSITPAPAPEERNPFTMFWEAYPCKIDRDDAWEVWKAINPDAGTVQAIRTGLEAWKRSDQWQDAGGRYIPAAAKWLHKRRWECPPAPAGNPAGRQLDADELVAIRRMQEEYQ